MSIVKHLWLLVVMALGGIAPAALAQDRQWTIADIRADRDGDTMPDARGDTVYVVATVQVAVDVIRAEPRITVLHDGTAGVMVLGVPAGLTLREGDLVAVTGFVKQSQGNTFLQALQIEATGQRGTLYPATTVALEREQLEAYEGQLVKVSGSLVGMGDVPNGRYVTLGNERSTIVVFAFESGTTGLSFEDLSLGSHMTITGIVGQFDREAPFNAAYQLYPRSQDDLSVSLLPPRFFLMLVIGVCVTALLSGLWIYLLRRRVQQRMNELELSEARYMRLFDHVTVPIAIHAIEDKKPILVEFNEIAEQVFGYREDMLHGRSWFDLLSIPGRRLAALHFREVEREQRGVAAFEMRVADGSLHLFEVRSVTFDEGGRQLMLSVAQDITERKAYEDGLIAARREAERLTQLKSQFLANMSHEIRTPLTGIIGFAEILTQELEGDPREFASIIQTSGERLLETLNSVLDLSKLDSGQLRTHVHAFNLITVTADVVEALQALAIKKGIHLVFAADVPALEVESDPALVTRLLNNLIGNAVKFTAEGNVQVRVREAQDMAVIEVEDSGIGISVDFLPHIFDEFAQESDGMTRDYEGSGLGLAISKRLVDLLDGTIEVESELGKGTTFTIHLPRRVASAASAPARLPR
ncbi:MAG: HAMP domain-containing sensor histidine kinase [Bacteroidota bacterium]